MKVNQSKKISRLKSMPKEIWIGQYSDSSKASGWTTSKGWFISCSKEHCYVPKGSELRSLLRYVKRWQSNELDRNALTVLGIMEREINRRLK